MNRFAIVCILSVPVFFIANTASLAAPQETGSAKCTDGRDNDRDGLTDGDDPDCADDPSNETIFFGDTVAKWSGSGLVREASSRACHLGDIQDVSGVWGHYSCPMNGELVTASLAGGQAVNKKGNATDDVGGYCTNGLVGDFTPNTSYTYDWEGDCTSGSGCRVRIKNWFWEIAGIPQGPAGTGLIILEGFRTVTGAGNPNPFEDSYGGANALSIDEVRVTFKGDGTNKAVATCEWSTDIASGIPGFLVGDVKFETEPASPPASP